MTPPQASDIVPGEDTFVQRVMGRLNRPGAPPVIITARGSRYQGPVIQALLHRAENVYGADNLFHITPPFSEQVSDDAFFRELGRQCRFPEATSDSVTLVYRSH